MPSYDEELFQKLQTIYEQSVFAKVLDKAEASNRLVLLKNGEIFCDADINKVKKEFGSVEQFLIKYIK